MVDVRFSSSVHIMLSLAHAARRGDDLLTSVQLAEGLKANPALVRKLLVPLSQAGLIETFKGKTGGARLAKAPKQINLREIYEAAVDREVACSRDNLNAHCPIGSHMKKVFGAVAEGMENSLLKYLESTTLQQLLAQAKCS